MAYESLGQAAKATGLSRSTILRSIKAGKISATRSERTNDWTIDPAELHRLYPVKPSADHAADRVTTNGAIASDTAATALHEAQVAALKDVADLLRRQLDDVRSDRDHWREIAGRLSITDQTAQPAQRKSRWWWRRSAA